MATARLALLALLCCFSRDVSALRLTPHVAGTINPTFANLTKYYVNSSEALCNDGSQGACAASASSRGARSRPPPLLAPTPLRARRSPCPLGPAPLRALRPPRCTRRARPPPGALVPRKPLTPLAAAFYFQPSINQHGSDEWVIYLEGGGWCFSDGTCMERMRTTPGLMSSAGCAALPTPPPAPPRPPHSPALPTCSWPEFLYMGGIFDTDLKRNPWAYANKVFVGYCSSDSCACPGAAAGSGPA